MMVVFQTLFVLLFFFLAGNIAYLLVLSVAGRLRKYIPYQPVDPKKKIAVLIPSFREDAVIVNTAQKAAEHNYPADFFTVFIAADQLQAETVEKLRRIPVHVQVMDFKGKSSKARSLHTLMEGIDADQYDIALVLDGDNVMMPGCLEKVNAAFQKGFRCVQMHRTAKNANNEMALLDGISEEINNNIFRNGQRALGFSSCLIGSGMAFEFQMLKSIFSIPSILDNPGEDREVDTILVKQGIEIEFIPDADVYDEKVSSAQVFERQRLRWLEAQQNHINMILSPSYFKGRRGKDFWNRFIINLMPPRVLMIAVFFPVFAVAMLSGFFGLDLFRPALAWWVLLFLMLGLALFISIPARQRNVAVLAKAMSRLFSTIVRLVKALFRMKPKRREFIHTPKTFTD